MLTACSTLDNIQKTHNVMVTLQEADRQFSIESTEEGQLPTDTAPKKWIDNAIALMPHSDVPYIGDGDDPGLIAILEVKGRYPLLIQYLEKAIKDPKLAKNPQILLPLADALQRMGPQSEAQTTYAAALKAINSSMKTAGSTFDPNEDLLLDRARAEYYGGDRAQSIKDFDSIMTTNPDYASSAENDLAYFYSLDRSDMKDAKKLATAAVADARRSGDDIEIGTFIDTLAWVDHQAGDDKSAIILEQEAASLTPLEADVQFHLGEICRAEGQYQLARLAYIRAIKINPFFPEARSGLSSLPAGLSS